MRRNSTLQGHTGFYPLYTANMSWRDFGTGTIDVTSLALAGGCCVFPIWHTAILEIVITFVALYHMKRAKVNMLRQLSLSPYKQLKHVNCRSRKARQSALIVEKMSSLQRDPSPFHIPTEPAAWPSKHLLRRWHFRCEDWNGVKPCTESRLGTSRKRNCKGNLKHSKHTICKALTRNFLLANHNDEKELRLKSKCNSGRMILVHHESEKGSDQNTGLKS